MSEKGTFGAIGGRRAVAALTALASLAIAAPAAAGTDGFENGYQGRAEKDKATYFGFDLAPSGKSVKHVTAVLDYHCQGSGGEGPNQFLGEGQGSLDVKKDKTFAGTMNVPINLRGGIPKVTYKVKGKLQSKGKSKGTIDAEFVTNTENRGVSGTLRCYTGRLDWKAKKGAHVNVQFDTEIRGTR